MTEYVRPTHQDGIAVAEAIAAEYGITWADMRQIAAQHMEDTMPDLEEIGSSDVSCHLSSLGNWEPHVLRSGAQRVAGRNRLLDDIAASSGQTREQTLDGLRRLLAPAN